jgi:hypothetical protein
MGMKVRFPALGDNAGFEHFSQALANQASSLWNVEGLAAGDR